MIAQVLVEGSTIVWLAYAMKMFYFIQKLVLNWFSLWFLELVCSGLRFRFSAGYVECKIRETSLVVCYMYRTQVFVCKLLLTPSGIQGSVCCGRLLICAAKVIWNKL